jgi:glycosyltransferase involved in cell wall biosynthesis
MVEVSVIIPTHRRPAFLEDAIASVLQQTYTQFELIVVYGGAQPKTAEALEAIHDDRLHTIARNQPLGSSAARNAGLEAATGQYVVFLDDDDYLLEHAIETLLQTFHEQPDDCAGVIACEIEKYPSGKTNETHVPEGVVDRYEDAPITRGSCVFFQNVAVKEVGGFDASFPARADADFLIRMLSRFRLFYLNERLYVRRHHEDQVTRDPEVNIEGNLRLLEKHAENLSLRRQLHYLNMVADWYRQIGTENTEDLQRKIGQITTYLNSSDNALSATESAECYHLLAHVAAKLGQPSTARARWRRAIQYCPYNKTYWFYYWWTHFGTIGYGLGMTISSRIYRPIAARLGH